MKVLKHTVIYLLAVILLANVQVYSQNKQNIGKIFSKEMEENLSDKQLKYFNYEKNKETSNKEMLFKLIKSQTELRNASSISIDIFGNEVTFDIKEVKINPDKSVSLIGFDEKYEFFMTIDKTDITASISFDNKIYAIVPLGERMHSLIEIDLSKYKPEEELLMLKEVEKKNDILQKVKQVSTSNSDIDILVAYTPAASSAVSNISTLINNAISQANASFNESGINVTYHLIYSTEINIVEGQKNSTQILDEFDSNPTILSLRDELRADLCFLITNSDSVSGAAWPVSDPSIWTSSKGFAIGNYNYVRDYKTFSHETGHNFGALHNYEKDKTIGYKHGYLNTSANFCTIMAYWTTNPSQRKNIWSDPNNTWNGYARGVVDTSENVRWLNEQRGDIESYRTFQTSGTISSNHHWRRNITLTGNVYVNATLTIESDCNVNLNGHFIKSTGGTIVQESGSTINGLNAYLKYNSTLKGFFPSISSAINNAGSYYTVELLGKTYNQNISTSKDYFTLKGKGYNSTYINGDITFTNADHTGIEYLRTRAIITNNSYVDLYSVKADRFSIYGDEVQINYVRTNGDTPNQITNADGTVDNSNLEDMLVGMDMKSNSAYNVQSYFCGNVADINAFSGSVAYAWYNDAFSYNPDYSCSGNVHYIWKNVCGMNKRTENGTKEKVNTSKSKDELEEIDQDYTSLLKRVNDDYVEKGEVDMKKYENDYNNVIDDYESFLEKYPSSTEAPTAIFRTVHCYQQQDNYKGYDEFINVFLADKKYESIRPHVQRHNIDLNVEKGKYKEAIEVAENIINNYKIDEDLYCELLYEKGLIYKYHLNEKEEAEKMFKTIVENYPKNKMFSYAEIELGENETKDEKGEVKESLETKKNNFGIESYPNPFNPSTTLSYSLPSTSNVKLEIYDVMGRIIKSFTANTQSSGKHQVVWDGTNSNGVKVSSGIYIYRFEATAIETNEHFVKSAKLMLVK